MKKTGRPKKHPEAVKTEYIEIRCEESEKQSFRDAADAAGMPMSGWMRDRLRKASRKELEDVGKAVPFLERLTA
jgi:uncharacterized protein (DUF1778 family)